MQSSAATDPEEAGEVFSEFLDYVDRNELGLIKFGKPMRRELNALRRHLERIGNYLELAEAGEPLEIDT